MQVPEKSTSTVAALTNKPSDWSQFVKVAGVIALSTAAAWPISHFVHPSTLILIYLVGIIIASYRWSRAAALFSCFLSVFIYDYLYVPPFYQLLPHDSDGIYTLLGMSIISLLVSTMSSMLRKSAYEAVEREQTERTISDLNRAMANTRTLAGVIDAAVAQVRSSAGLSAGVILCPSESQLLDEQSLGKTAEIETASQALENRNLVFNVPKTTLFLPLLSGNCRLGVMVVHGQPLDWTPQRIKILTAITEQLSLGIERAVGLEAAERARLQVESVKLRNALLSSVSHDLRTPLSSIMGAASSILCDPSLELPPHHRELLHSIQNESDRLARFLKNLLDMTRIESGAIRVKKEWQSVEESIGVVLRRLARQLAAVKVVTKLPDELPLVLYDEQLIDQVLSNLLDNAAKYAPPETEVSIWAEERDDGIMVGVSNRGCTIPAGEESKMFDKFYRGNATAATYGAGLGLAICKGIMQAHGGQIWAERTGDDGISICFLFPREAQPPKIDADEDNQQQLERHSLENA